MRLPILFINGNSPSILHGFQVIADYTYVKFSLATGGATHNAIAGGDPL